MSMSQGVITLINNWDNVKVLEKETKDVPRKILEAIHIKKKEPNLHR